MVDSTFASPINQRPIAEFGVKASIAHNIADFSNLLIIGSHTFVHKIHRRPFGRYSRCRGMRHKRSGCQDLADPKTGTQEHHMPR